MFCQTAGESGEIPDGFFDDPVEDAKVHHKPYVDPLDAQWELFQKEIKLEAHKSEVIEVRGLTLLIICNFLFKRSDLCSMFMDLYFYIILN